MTSQKGTSSSQAEYGSIPRFPLVRFEFVVFRRRPVVAVAVVGFFTITWLALEVV